MRWIAILAVLTVPASAQEPLALDVSTREAVAEFTDMSPAALLKNLRSTDRADRRYAWEVLQQVERFDQVAYRKLVLVAAESKDPAVRTAATARLEWPMLDLAGSEQFLELGLAEVFEPDPEIDFEPFRRVLGSSWIPRLLEEIPPRTREVYNVISQVHRQVRAEHIPLLCRYAECAQSGLREEALDTIKIAADYTDQHRDAIGKVLLGWIPGPRRDHAEEKDDYVPKVIELPQQRSGHSPVLYAVLDLLFADGIDEQRAKFRPWAARWAFDERPGADDRRLYLRLAKHDDLNGRKIAARGLRARNDPFSIDALEGLTADDETSVVHLAHASLAHLGIDTSAEWLRTEAETSAGALLMWIDAVGEPAIRETIEAACGEDEQRGADWIRRLRDADEEFFFYGVPLPTNLGERLEAAAFANDIDAKRLAAIFELFEATHTERLVRRFLARARPDDVVESWPTGLCEVVDAEATRTTLRPWCHHKDPDIRSHARRELLRIGDPKSPKVMIEASDHGGYFELARSRCEAVREYLVEEFEDGDQSALFAIAAHDGLDEHVAKRWSFIESEEAPQWQSLVLERRPVDALVTWLAATDTGDGLVSRLGSIPDPRIARWLERHRTERHMGKAFLAIPELAIQGNGDARAEMIEVIHGGYYSWLDNLDGWQLTLGHDHSLLPFWASELESNCCRVVIVDKVTETMLGRNVHDTPTGHLATPTEVLAPLMRKYAPYIRFSRAAGHGVVVVPDPK